MGLSRAPVPTGSATSTDHEPSSPSSCSLPQDQVGTPAWLAWVQASAGNAAAQAALGTAEGVGLEPLPSTASDEAALSRIREIHENAWVGPLDEGELEQLWASFGAREADVRAAHPDLWQESVDRGAELLDGGAEHGLGGDPSLGLAPMALRPFPLAPTPPTLTPVPPAAGGGLAGAAGEALTFALRRVLPVVAGLWPKSTAPAELTDYPPIAPTTPAPTDVIEPDVQTAPDGPLAPGPEGAPLSPDKDPCDIVVTCPHLGGDPVHNACADSVSDPQFRGCDVYMNGKHYDAANEATRTMWEIKTTRYSDPKYNKYTRMFETDKQVKSSAADAEAAARCGWDYILSVSDQLNFEMLEASNRLSPLVKLLYRPECLEGAPDVAPAP